MYVERERGLKVWMGDADKNCSQNRWVRHDKKFVTSQVGHVEFQKFVLLKYTVIGDHQFSNDSIPIFIWNFTEMKVDQLDSLTDAKIR